MRKVVNVLNTVTFLLPVAVAIALYSINLKDDLFGDEFATYRFSVLQVPSIFDPERASTSFVFLSLSKLGHMVVNEPWGIRLSSVVWGVATVLMIGFLARETLGKECQTLAMWVAAISPMLVEFSAEGRPYAIMAFWGTAFLYCLIAFVKKESWSSTVLLGLVSVAALLSKTIVAPNLVFGACYYLAVRQKLTKKAIVAVAMVLPVAAYSAVLLLYYGDLTANVPKGNVGVSTLNFVAKSLFVFNFGYNALELPELGAARNVDAIMTAKNNVMVIGMIGVAGMGIMYASVSLARVRPKAFWLLASYIVVPSAVIVVSGQMGYTVIREKFLIAMLGAYLVLLTGILRELASTKAGRVSLVGFLLVVLVGHYNFFFHSERFSRRMQYSDLNQYILSTATPRDVVLIYHIPKARREFGPYYYTFVGHGLGLVDLADESGSAQKLESLALKIDLETEGKIFLISREAVRNAIDPDRKVVNAFSRNRIVHRHRFGRNLTLLEFSSRRIPDGRGR